jgi:hypothetical protein
MAGYKFTVPNGVYDVQLKFAEIYPYAYNGSRVFDIKIQGVTKLANFDIHAEAGKYNAIDKVFSGINVTTGLLTIEFVPKVGTPKVNALRVTSSFIGGPTPTPPATPTATPTSSGGPTLYRVNVGDGAYTDCAAQPWSPDQAWDGTWGYLGGTSGTYATSNPIAGTCDQTLYQTERWNVTGYRFTVPSGLYDVTLKFAEIYQYAFQGYRVFSIRINGIMVESNLDIFTAAGGKYKALDRTYLVNAPSGSILIEFIPVVRMPKVNAIEVKVH